METLCNLPHLVNNGVEWFRRMGTEKSTGTKILSVSGHVKQPGNYEIIMGTPLRELIYDICGGIRNDRELKAVIPGGSSMPMLPKDMRRRRTWISRRLQAAGSMLGSGGLIVFDETDLTSSRSAEVDRAFLRRTSRAASACRAGSGRTGSTRSSAASRRARAGWKTSTCCRTSA